ncbi:hypothetical protein [Streptococcus mitis]|uniref:Uncharacterized protein n=1 Tax=Streptococcus mitis TaxID=28037 RepID=A0A139Q9B8_STRMT|nr:hypothetical protein [Streptococcus mitis]KXT98951.1 hypothetical protein SMIDD28_00936 [Streptococcus mitis]
MSSLRWKRVGRFSMKNKNRLWITVPVSGLITLYVIRLIKVWITTITNNKSNLLDLSLLENIIVLVTFFSAIIFLLKVGLSNNKKQKIISILIIICFILTLFSYFISVGNKQVNDFLVFFTYILFNLLIYLLCDMILIVYEWVIKDESTMAPKLTFIWGLITFLIAILFKF